MPDKKLAPGLVAVLALLTAGPSDASVTRGDGVLSFNLGYATGKTAVSGDQIDGGIVMLGFERLDWEHPVSVGFSAGYGEITDEKSEGARTTNRTIATVPFYVTGKYWLGQGRIQGTLGLGLGVYFSKLRTTVIETGREFSSSGYAGAGLGVPVGVVVALGDTMLLNVNYTLNWTWSNEALENDLLHAVSAGIGFNLGQ